MKLVLGRRRPRVPASDPRLAGIRRPHFAAGVWIGESLCTNACICLLTISLQDYPYAPSFTYTLEIGNIDNATFLSAAEKEALFHGNTKRIYA